MQNKTKIGGEKILATINNSSIISPEESGGGGIFHGWVDACNYFDAPERDNVKTNVRQRSFEEEWIKGFCGELQVPAKQK